MRAWAFFTTLTFATLLTTLSASASLDEPNFLHAYLGSGTGSSTTSRVAVSTYVPSGNGSWSWPTPRAYYYLKARSVQREMNLGITEGSNWGWGFREFFYSISDYDGRNAVYQSFNGTPDPGVKIRFEWGKEDANNNYRGLVWRQNPGGFEHLCSTPLLQFGYGSINEAYAYAKTEQCSTTSTNWAPDPTNPNRKFMKFSEMNQYIPSLGWIGFAGHTGNRNDLITNCPNIRGDTWSVVAGWSPTNLAEFGLSTRYW